LSNAVFFRLLAMPLACLFLATAATAPAQAATLQACTKFELSRAISSARPGDVVEMCDGRWDDTVINFDVDGTRSAPIRLTAQMPGGVVLTGASRLLVSGDFAVVDGLKFSGRYTGTENTIVEFRSPSGRLCFDCRITNLTITDYNPSQSSMLTRWVVLHGKRNRIDHSHFKSKTNLGAMIQLRRGADQSPNNHRIDHNLLEDRPDFTGEGNQNGDTLEIGETGKFARGISGAVVEFNYLRNIHSDYEVVTVKSSGNILQYNVIESSRGVFSLRQGHSNVVHGNFMMGNGVARTGGIKIRGKDHVVTSNYISEVNPEGTSSLAGIIISSGTNEIIDIGGEGTAPYFKFERADGVKILHNTIVDSGQSATIGTLDPLPPRNIILANNIIVQRSGTAIDKHDMGTGFSLSSNIFHGSNIGADLSGVLRQDPQLIIDSAGIQRPTLGSPAIDAVQATESNMRDMDGQLRQSPLLQDIGADEVVAGEPGRGPARLCDVGPRTYRAGLPTSCDDVSAEGPRPLPPSLLVAE